MRAWLDCPGKKKQLTKLCRGANKIQAAKLQQQTTLQQVVCVC